MTHEGAHEQHDRVIEGHEDQYDAFWFLTNVWPGTKVDGELDALWFRPFLEVVKDVFDLFKGDVVLKTKSR
jgi:hypothetical protein